MSGLSRDLGGRVALVTGAARRLGRDLALRLARCGADVFIHYHSSEAEATEVAGLARAEGVRAWTVRADLSSAAGRAGLVAGVLAETDRIDVLVNNVGNYDVKALRETDADDWRDMLETNLIAPHELIRLLACAFPPRGGHVVNIGYAGVETLRTQSSSTPYAVSKLGLLLATRSWAEELAPQQVRVNMISPGHLENSVDLPADIPSAIPLGRAGRLHDVADALVWLLADDSYVTGINVDVAGGYRL